MDSNKIFIQNWQVQNPTAVIALVHGLGEHCLRYKHFAAFFNQQKIAVVGMDIRGHGQSEGKRGHSPAYSYLLDDLDAFLSTVQKLYPQKSIYLYGHSMGGGIVLNYLLKQNPSKLAGVIASAPLVKPAFQPSRVVLALAKVLRNIHPTFTQNNQVNTAGLSRDPKVIEAYKKDTLVGDKITAALAVDILKAGDFLYHFHGDAKLPLLVMHGDADKLTSPDASKKFASQLSGDVTYHQFEGLYHEIHNEPEQKEVMQFVLDWVKKHL